MIAVKIVHVTPDFYPVVGGIQTYVAELSKRLIREGHEVVVVTRIPPWFRTKKREFIDGIEVFRFPFKTRLRYSYSWEAVKFLMDLDYDVLHVHVMGQISDLTPFLKLKGKVIFHTHGGIFHTSHLNVLKWLYFQTSARVTLHFADKIIAQSKKDKKLFEKIADKKNISLINYGIDWKLLSGIKRKSDGKTLIYVGRLSDNKRLDRMIKVLQVVKREIPDVKLLLVGSDWGEKKKLRKLSKDFGLEKNVFFIGSVPHEKIDRYLARADMFLLSSEYEGFGISIIEAMASGLAVVVNDIDASREILSKSNGYIVDFDDAEKTASIIVKLINNSVLRKKIGTHAKLDTKKYDWSVITEKVKNIYKELNLT